MNARVTGAFLVWIQLTKKIPGRRRTRKRLVATACRLKDVYNRTGESGGIFYGKEMQAWAQFFQGLSGGCID